MMKKIALLTIPILVLCLMLISCGQKNELERITTVYGELINYLSTPEFQEKLTELKENPDAITSLISEMNAKFDEIIKKNGFASEQDWRDQINKYQDNEQVSMLRDKLSTALAAGSGAKVGEKAAPPTRSGAHEYTIQDEIDALIEWMKNH